MKNQIRNAIVKFFVFAAVAVVMVGAAFAQKPQSLGGFERHSRQQSQEMMARNSARAYTPKQGMLTAANQSSFLIGKDFAIAIFDAQYLDEDEEAFNFTIIDLVYLIDKLEGQPEAAQLQNVLKGLIRNTAGAEKVKLQIQVISKTYLNRQKPEQQWYLNAGSVTMNMSISAFLADDEALKKGFSQLQGLIMTAPAGTPSLVLDPMNALAKLAPAAGNTAINYEAIFEGVRSVLESAGA